jgi:hypothetical protein
VALAMWVRDHYFPPSYAQASWKRLLPFIQLPGTITQDATLVEDRTPPVQPPHAQSRLGHPM